MSNPSRQTMTEAEFQDRERELRNRELELEREKRELKLQQSKVELEKQELRFKDDKAELEKKETELKEKIAKLEELETEFQKHGPDIIRLAISKKFRRGMIGTKEHELRQSGDINALQRWRYERHVYEQDLDEAEDQLAEFLDVETGLREIAQREICLGERFKQDPARLDQEIEIADREYKRLEHEWWMIRDSFSDGPLVRGFELWRGNPKWYMHRVLREDCAGRGGCCGRDCGCCLNRKLFLDREHAAGHCTVECGCCQKARGFELSEDEKKKFAIRYAVSQDGKKGLDLKDLHLKNLELQNLNLQHVLSEEAMKDTVMKYTFSDGEVAEYEQYTNEADFTDYESDDDECPRKRWRIRTIVESPKLRSGD
ncbi:hypothetical protein N7519_006724 [Penicillium mononematosum]|uniref:uncharacterized protein n=1 Tax=Penicillium mononematosum TaxID=268346 RepID=UPI002549AA15|nr:uncharacterized protein N7519_006724 [Penicillium mononematosum]KAJ6185423.1 hypothetical protein N7519_006724 [Penicillium mononematosum]